MSERPINITCCHKVHKAIVHILSEQTVTTNGSDIYQILN